MISLDENVLFIIFPLFFVVFFLFILGVFRFVSLRNQKKNFVKKIQDGGYDDYEGNYQEDPDLAVTQERSKNILVYLFSLFGQLFIGTKKSGSGAIPTKFLKGGLRNRNIETSFWGAKIISPFIFFGIFLVLKTLVFQTISTPYTIAIIVTGSLLAFYLPDIWLKQISDKRKERILKGLPDALDLLVICVEAGMGLDSALKRVGNELQLSFPDLSNEFNYLNLEMRAGKPRKDALTNFAVRTNLQETQSLVTLLIQTDKFGTSAAVALKVFSDSFRTQRFQRAEEKAAKLPVSILIPLILFIFPSLFVVILGPAAINIYQ